MSKEHRKPQMLEALRATLGNVTLASKRVGIERRTHYLWVKEDPEYAAAAKEVLEEQGDFVENKLLQLIKDGDTSAVIFYCKTRLRNRGYSERLEVSAPQLDPDKAMKALQAKIREALHDGGDTEDI